MARRRTKPKAKRTTSLGELLSGEVVGSALVVIAVLTFLSFFSSRRGEVTDFIVGGLRAAFGVGSWLAPVLLAALGAWLALRTVSDQRILNARRLLGLLGLFLAFEGIIHLVVGSADPWQLALDGGGGGAIGWLFSQGFIQALGFPATVGALAVIAIGSCLAITGIDVAQLPAILSNWWESQRQSGPVPDAPMLPLPLGHTESRLERLRKSLAGWWPPKFWPRQEAVRPTPPEKPVWQREPLAPAPAKPKRSPSSSQTKSTPAPPPPPPAAPVQSDAVRIIGGSGRPWPLPVLSEILDDNTEQDIQGEDIRRRAQIIEETLEGFGLPVQVVEANQGPAVTQFGLRPGTIVRRDRKGNEKRIKVRVSQIQALSNDLSLALAASPIRIEAPVPGRDVVGVEVPNVQISLVSLRGVMESEEFQKRKGGLTFGLGRDVSGQSAVADMVRMPHLLIAGATGSGKSVCVNAIIAALLLTHAPDTLHFLMIDPKRVELTVYNGIPHLIAPVVVDVERAVPVLQWATREMERRYKLFAKVSARNIEAYNEKLLQHNEQMLPYIVIVIDELADLMLSAPDDVERYICRIAQMARATGIHLVIATQRPSVDVVTGLIKANFPARIAFAVTSQIDSRVILDSPGAEQLLGRGDMLFMAPDASKLHRLQGCFVSDREAQRLVQYWRTHVQGSFDEHLLMPAEAIQREPEDSVEEAPADASPQDPPWIPGQEALQQPLWSELSEAESEASNRDDMYRQAIDEVRNAGRASVSLLQRKLRIGYSRAARLIDQMEDDGIVGPDLGGSRGREVITISSQNHPSA